MRLRDVRDGRLARWLVVLAASLAVLAWPERARADGERATAAWAWEVRWGDSPRDADGGFAWMRPPAGAEPDGRGWTTTPSSFVPRPDTLPRGSPVGPLWLRARLPDQLPERPALYVPRPGARFEAFVDGRPILPLREVERDDGFYRGWAPYILGLPNDAGGKHVYFRLVSDSDAGGGVSGVQLGDAVDLSNALVRRLVPHVAIAAILALLGVVVLGVGLLRQGAREFLGFGGFLFIGGLYVFTRSQFPGYFVGTRPWVWYVIELFSLYAIPPLYVVFHRATFGAGIRGTMRLVGWVSGAYFAASVVVSATGLIEYERTLLPFQYLLAVILFFILADAIRLAWGGDADARIFMGGLASACVIFMVRVLMDVNALPEPEIFRTVPLVPIGFFVLVAFLAAIVVRRTVNVYDLLQVYARDLERQNTALAESTTALEQKSHELDKKNTQLSRLNALKDEFLANTSHELRTPLNGIIGLAESLLETCRGRLREAERGQLRMIMTSGKRLSTLINDILDFSKLRHRSIELSRSAVDVRTAVDIVLELSRPLVANRSVALRNLVPEALAPALADENRLQQILHNLTGNAIKFTHAGSVEISAEERSDLIVIHVRDTGIGIPTEKFARIFESFEQGDGGTEREYGGTGLGLAITKKLVELHGGALGVESKVGEGTVFSFTLPRAIEGVASVPAPMLRTESLPDEYENAYEEDAPPPSARVSALPIPRRRYRVLAADDDPVNLAVLGAQLGQEGFDMVQVADGFEALARLGEQGRFDAVLLDVMMPRMSGYEVCRRVRSVLATKELPVLLLTAKNQPDDVVEGFEAGANDYLTKPFSRKELLARVQTHIWMAQKNVAFGRFVPREFLDLLGRRDVVDVQRGDCVRREMTVLFSDIRGFTTMAEQMAPEETFRFLNRCLERIGPRIRENRGFIDKYIGDSVMALFPEGPADAIAAALAIAREVALYSEELAKRGGAPVAVGTAIHRGPLMLGTIGEEHRIEATVIADTVNVAARLEGIAKALGVSVLVSEDVVAGIDRRGDLGLRSLGRVRVRGRGRPMAVFEVTAAYPPAVRSARDASAARFAEALARYEAAEFDAAIAHCEAILGDAPDDGPARFLVEQCRAFAARRPIGKWDGTLALETR